MSSMISPIAQNLYIQRPGAIEIRDEPIAEPQPGQVQIKTRVSAISAGTELLFYRGQVPPELSVDSAISGMSDKVAYPLRYGYACAGEIVAVGDPGLDSRLGQRVFAFAPHASLFNLPSDDVIPIPTNVSWESAALFPNMETAISLAHDANPISGERVLIMGQGIVGLLTLWVLSAQRGTQVAIAEPLEMRRSLALRLGADDCFSGTDPEALRAYDPDVILELSGNPSALHTAIEVAGFQSRIIVGSWYGTKAVELPLGKSYHRNRISIYGSQVSTLPASLSGRWQKERRYALAWKLLGELPTREIISHRVNFGEASDAYEKLDQSPSEIIQILLTYPGPRTTSS